MQKKRNTEEYRKGNDVEMRTLFFGLLISVLTVSAARMIDHNEIIRGYAGGHPLNGSVITTNIVYLSRGRCYSIPAGLSVFDFDERVNGIRISVLTKK